MTFKVGDPVAWNGVGHSKYDKTGRVIQIIGAGIYVRWERIPEKERFGQLLAEGYPRTHESYLVRVGRKIYWPRVAGLRAGGAAPITVAIEIGSGAPIPCVSNAAEINLKRNIAAYLLDRAAQHDDESGSWVALADAARAIMSGEVEAAVAHGELAEPDLLRRVDAMAAGRGRG